MNHHDPMAETSIMIESDEDRLMAVRLRAGQADAWQALYDAYAEPVWRVVARQMGTGASDVADVVQETFLSAARSAASFEPSRGSAWFWLCGIARRHVALYYRKRASLDRVRRAAGRLMTKDGSGTAWLTSHEPLPEGLLESAELATLVRAALTELDDDYSDLLSARYLEGVPVDQIAAAGQSTTTAVRSKLARARQAFRQVFVRMSKGSGDEVPGELYEP
jgi:RNA polymerase sigma-70 factor, ECF subfamily